MDNNVQKEATDITDARPACCRVDGEQDFECRCDECDPDVCSLCFPELDLINKEKIKDIKIPPLSKRHKIRMNRLFRERVGGSFLPYPEADNFYERVRSKVVVTFKINEISDRRKKRRLSR